MNEQMENLLYEALETEIGGVQVYTNAVRCAQNDELKEEWEKYLEQTMRHEQILREVLETLGMDAEKETPGRKVVRHIGESLVQAMVMAREEGEPEAAQIVAAECVVLAETKDHQNWELLGEIAKKLTGEEKKALSEAHEEVEDEEDEHLYHTQGWSRELWLESPRDGRGAASAGREEGRQDGDRRRAREAGPQRDDARAARAAAPRPSTELARSAEDPRISDDRRRTTAVVGDPPARLAEARLPISTVGRRPRLARGASAYRRAGVAPGMDRRLRQPVSVLRRSGDRARPRRTLAVRVFREGRRVSARRASAPASSRSSVRCPRCARVSPRTCGRRVCRASASSPRWPGCS